MFVYSIKPPAKNCNICLQETAYQHKGRRKKLQKNKSSRHNSVTAAVPWTNLIIKSCNAKRRTTMKMASRLIDLISKKTNCMCSTLFLLVSKKQICTCSTLFCLSLALVLHDYNAVLYDQKRQTSQLHIIFYGGIVVFASNILFPVLMFGFIFHCRSFSPCWPLAFLIFSPPL